MYKYIETNIKIKAILLYRLFPAIISILFLFVACSSHQQQIKAFRPEELTVVNEANLSDETVNSLKKEFLYWTPKVYKYNQYSSQPVKCFLTNNHWIGSYYKGVIHVPAFFQPESIVETYLHELGHHATGHDSTIFFKEGIATATLEEVLMVEGKIPSTWPQYGQTNENWIKLYLATNTMMPLKTAISWPRYMGGTSDGDFLSWQIYVIGGAFIRWYIKNYGYSKFRRAFKNRKFDEPHEELEKEWMLYLNKKPFIPFLPQDYLPVSPRYLYYIKRLTP